MKKNILKKLSLYNKNTTVNSISTGDTKKYNTSTTNDFLFNIKKNIFNIDAFVNSNNHDLYYFKETILLNDKYGTKYLENYLPFKINPLSTLSFDSDEESYISPYEILFFDIETSGFSSNPNAIAFLVGFSFFTDKGLKTEQYFLNTPASEKDFIQIIEDKFSKFKYLMTFNGKSFDVPFIISRRRRHNSKPVKYSFIHFDLYHIFKRVFKNTMQANKLSSYEQKFLGLFRKGDTPGKDIPQIYYDYLKFEQSDKLEGVLIHNKLDVISLAFLLLEVLDLLFEKRELNIFVINNLAKISSSKKNNFQALELLKNFPISKYFEKEAIAELYFLALLYKKEKFQDKAKNIFSQIIEFKINQVSKNKVLETLYFQYYTGIELAKVFEHSKKEFQTALNYTLKSESSLVHIKYLKLNTKNQDNSKDKTTERIKKRSWQNWLEKESNTLSKRKLRLKNKI